MSLSSKNNRTYKLKLQKRTGDSFSNKQIRNKKTRRNKNLMYNEFFLEELLKKITFESMTAKAYASKLFLRYKTIKEFKNAIKSITVDDDTQTTLVSSLDSNSISSKSSYSTPSSGKSISLQTQKTAEKPNSKEKKINSYDSDESSLSQLLIESRERTEKASPSSEETKSKEKEKTKNSKTQETEETFAYSYDSDKTHLSPNKSESKEKKENSNTQETEETLDSYDSDETYHSVLAKVKRRRTKP